MTAGDIPSGKNTHLSQSDGAASAVASAPQPGAVPPAAALAPSETFEYAASVRWKGDGTGCGEALVAKESFLVPIGSAKELGGCGKGANSEEMLLAAVGTCWVATWAIFLGKLGVPYEEPRLRLTANLGKDPAGGFRLTRMRIHARVPAALLAQHRPTIEKTVALAEKYCIISKVAKAAMPVEVILEEI
jgi:organic hydroperoxide reductase OsmC/OhrA